MKSLKIDLNHTFDILQLELLPSSGRTTCTNYKANVCETLETPQPVDCSPAAAIKEYKKYNAK